MQMIEGRASAIIRRPAAEIFAAVCDITRMGDWSPECTSGRWVPPTTQAGVGAKFEGDNIAKLGPITLKRWTTTSEVTDFVPNEVFEFVAEGHTTWRYELTEHEDATTVTEIYRHPPNVGWQRFLYDVVAQRGKSMVKGMEKTLAGMKLALES